MWDIFKVEKDVASAARFQLTTLEGLVLTASFLKISALGFALVSAGCATRPESISASFVSHEKYMGQTCPELSDSMADARAKLSDYSKMQLKNWQKNMRTEEQKNKS